MISTVMVSFLDTPMHTVPAQLGRDRCHCWNHRRAEDCARGWRWGVCSLILQELKGQTVSLLFQCKNNQTFVDEIILGPHVAASEIFATFCKSVPLYYPFAVICTAVSTTALGVRSCKEKLIYITVRTDIMKKCLKVNNWLHPANLQFCWTGTNNETPILCYTILCGA